MNSSLFAAALLTLVVCPSDTETYVAPEPAVQVQISEPYVQRVSTRSQQIRACNNIKNSRIRKMCLDSIKTRK